jgi:autotransporter-associated beta strand protein
MIKGRESSLHDSLLTVASGRRLLLRHARPLCGIKLCGLGINRELTRSNVTVSTGSPGSQNGDITVSSAINIPTSKILTLEASGGVGGSAGISIGSGSSLVINQSGTSTYSGIISGAGSLVKQGAGTLTLSGNSTFSGGTLVSLGSVRMSSRTALGTGTVTLNEASTAGDVSVTTTYYSTLSQPSASTAVNDDLYHIANNFVIAAKVSGQICLGTTPFPSPPPLDGKRAPTLIVMNKFPLKVPENRRSCILGTRRGMRGERTHIPGAVTKRQVMVLTMPLTRGSMPD